LKNKHVKKMAVTIYKDSIAPPPPQPSNQALALLTSLMTQDVGKIQHMMKVNGHNNSAGEDLNNREEQEDPRMLTEEQEQ